MECSIFLYCTPRIARCQGVTEWAVLIGYFQLCTHSNHTRKWNSEKTVNCVSAIFHYRGIV